MNTPRVMITSPASGSGKTTITCGILQALKNRGKLPVSGKCGPDYIDPMFHEAVLKIPSENLDLFFCQEEVVKALLKNHAKQGDITILEGAMGYYDGQALNSWKGSAYDVAKVTDTPVILVIPCKGMALSLVPVIQGMLSFRKDHHIRGVILNQISQGMYGRMKEMLEEHLEIPVLGYVPPLSFFSLQSRHLGLVTPGERVGLSEEIEVLGNLLEQTIDLDALTAIAQSAPPLLTSWNLELEPQSKEAAPVRIAVAKDEAFCFYYRDNLTLLEKLGCELTFFSPIRDHELPVGTRGLLLGGGYPELYAKKLSENHEMRESIRVAVTKGLPCIAECGGFMYLQEMLEEKDGTKYPMVGAIKGVSFPTGKLVRFGYVTLESQQEQGYLPKGETLKGHEFHHWDSTHPGTACLAVKPEGEKSWNCIHAKEHLFAGYPHLHFYSNLKFAQRFVALCREEKK